MTRPTRAAGRDVPWTTATDRPAPSHRVPLLATPFLEETPMTTMTRIRRSRAARGLALPLLAGAVLGLTACGGGDDSASPDVGAAPRGGGQAGYGGAGGGPGPGGRTAEERAELRSCLEQQGVTLPSRPAGGPGGGRGPGDGAGGTSATERRKFQAALKSCGVTAPAGGRRQGGGRPDVDDADYRRSIEAYVACVRKNGFDLPDPDFSGDGPVFDPDEVDQADAAFRKASAACRSTLRPSRGSTAPPSQGDDAGTRTGSGAAT